MKEDIFQTRYPFYNVLDKWSSLDWDDQTREVVRKRLENIPPIRFFTDDEVRTLTAVVERVIPQPDRTAHLLGTCRMGDDPKNSVVNADCRSHDVPNLYICDGSVFTTSTGVNPSLTIEAIAARTADQICNPS